MKVNCGICEKPLVLSEYGANHYYCSRCNVSVKIDVEGRKNTIEIKNKKEQMELLRAIRLAERIALPDVADLTRIRDEITDMVFEG